MDNELKDWTTPDKDDNIDVPDELMPLFNKIGMQLKFYTISGKNEIATIAYILPSTKYQLFVYICNF